MKGRGRKCNERRGERMRIFQVFGREREREFAGVRMRAIIGGDNKPESMP